MDGVLAQHLPRRSSAMATDVSAHDIRHERRARQIRIPRYQQDSRDDPLGGTAADTGLSLDNAWEKKPRSLESKFRWRISQADLPVSPTLRAHKAFSIRGSSSFRAASTRSAVWQCSSIAWPASRWSSGTATCDASRAVARRREAASLILSGQEGVRLSSVRHRRCLLAVGSGSTFRTRP